MDKQVKVPYAQLALIMDQMYAVDFDDNDIEGINEHIEHIVETMHALGYDEQEYLDYLIYGAPKETKDN